MAESYQRQSPLAHLNLAARALAPGVEAGVLMREQSFRGQLVLRGNPRSRKFKSVVKKVFGADLPVEANTASEGKRGHRLLWLGPDEWLAVVPDGHETKAAADLDEAMPEEHFAVADVSGSRTIISLSGPRARDVLMKGCSLDLHPRVFSAGQCAQSSLARCHMLLHQVADTPAYDLYVHRSFADYLWRWLEDAAKEYGVAIDSAAD